MQRDKFYKPACVRFCVFLVAAAVDVDVVVVVFVAVGLVVLPPVSSSPAPLVPAASALSSGGSETHGPWWPWPWSYDRPQQRSRTQPEGTDDALINRHPSLLTIFGKVLPPSASLHKHLSSFTPTISWATSSGTSLLRSKENSMASLSLYLPKKQTFNRFLVSSYPSERKKEIYSVNIILLN